MCQIVSYCSTQERHSCLYKKIWNRISKWAKWRMSLAPTQLATRREMQLKSLSCVWDRCGFRFFLEDYFINYVKIMLINNYIYQIFYQKIIFFRPSKLNLNELRQSKCYTRLIRSSLFFFSCSVKPLVGYTRDKFF